MRSPDELVLFALKNMCSDIHLTEGREPVFRRFGELSTLSGEVVSRGDILRFVQDEAQKKPVPGEDMDFASNFAGGRQRVNLYWHGGLLTAAVRLFSNRIPTIEELRLPSVLKKMANEPRGLVLVTGPTGCGKSTTLAAMINYIGASRSCHILTIEDPVEYVYTETRSLVHQREVGRDVGSFTAALRSALREDPDVIMVGEMRDYETVSAAVTAAETGHLVLSTLHTTGAARTMDRIIDIFPPHAKDQVRAQLSGTLKGIVTQQLIPRKDGDGRIVATEVLMGTDAVCNLIREGKPHQLNSVIQSGAAYGMHTLDANLALLVKNGFISMETAERYASNPSELWQLMK